MKIEEAIKQTVFKNEIHKLVVNLIYTGNWVNYKNLELLKPFGITPQQYNILRILKGQYPNPATINLLMERMLDKMSNVSRLTDKLVLKKYVSRKSSGSDRRCVDILITEKGIELLKKIAKEESEWEKQFTTLSEKECKVLNSLLDKFRIF